MVMLLAVPLYQLTILHAEETAAASLTLRPYCRSVYGYMESHQSNLVCYS
jgi:hypothetical protein